MNYFLISLSILVIVSCTKDKGLPSSVDNTTTGASNPCTTNISYSLNIAPIINNSCALPGCHTPTGFKDLSTYSAVKAEIVGYSGTLFVRRIKPGGGMPLIGPPLEICEVMKIETWVNDGFPDN